MLTVVAFVVALGLLIAVHEWGHYRVAVACGVKVLRFSVGFGKPLVRWVPRRQRPGQATEFVIGMLPLGGYVRMLDEREGPVDPAEKHLAFNNQSVRARAAIVAAGPAANLLLAVLLYSLVNWWGVEEPRAVLASPVAGSVAERAGLRGGEEVVAVSDEPGHRQPVRSFETLRWQLTRASLEGRDLVLSLAAADGAPARDVRLALSSISTADADPQLFRRVGLVGPWTEPVLGELMPGLAGEKAGLRRGDVVLGIGNTPVVDGVQLRELIRTQVRDGQAVTQPWRIRRDGVDIAVDVTPDVRTEAAGVVARIGAYVGGPPAMTVVRHGPIEGLWNGAVRTWEVSLLTLKMMGRMVIGEASLKNLSGPLTIADFAGKSASLGLTHYLVFLALISVSLGVLNLLPLPVLDGGHLMYYLWEAVTGRGVSSAWMDRLQRTGVALLLVMMSIALFNDVTRLFAST
ncbi:MAG: RIP metalloprotease RseP [Burkholderiales bacterium]|jgi:regulator of sigma E protease|nr:RIP metalloprotease RseP [Burkholderiales bacterium]